MSPMFAGPATTSLKMVEKLEAESSAVQRMFIQANGIFQKPCRFPVREMGICNDRL